MAQTDEGRLVEAARAGDQRAFGQLFDGWFDRVHDLSRRIVRDREVAAEVAQDAFLKAWTRLDTLDDVDAFGGWLLRIARNASLNRLDKERRSVAFDDETMTFLTDLDPDDIDPLAELDRAEQVNLVWTAAEALGPRDLSVLDLHLRHGLGAGELAEELGTNRNNAHQILHTLRDRLATNVRALVLWRAGRPACLDLRTALAGGSGQFDKSTVKIIDRHADACVDCGRERTDRLSPAALFGAAPVVAAPILLKGRAAAGLESDGVPMSGSTALSGDNGTSASARADGDGGEPPQRPGGEGARPAVVTSGGGDGDPPDPPRGGGDPPEPPDGGDDGSGRRRRRSVGVMIVLAVLFGGTVGWFAVAASKDDVAPPPGPTVVPPASGSIAAESSSTTSTTSTTPSTTTTTRVPTSVTDPPTTVARPDPEPDDTSSTTTSTTTTTSPNDTTTSTGPNDQTTTTSPDDATTTSVVLIGIPDGQLVVPLLP